jgi:hypothetical protein
LLQHHAQLDELKFANAAQEKAEKEGKIIIKDSIADIFLQQILTRPAVFFSFFLCSISSISAFIFNNFVILLPSEYLITKFS